ncbi:hypothetical protein MUN81_12860 [Hymenobacter sp. 5317J-9]|uniref:hypothetical protein n=1 Tax=Hymenobacter sp. 5317J-9 TaxID=2932250 RepID=UPI001FD66D51|nr:hypothetical protein [Hymenobacter sp. 5317J-9]UOQ96145.1 hypothetical protein MUN81_12860 [Hymenobacter sp. 5317J-9]
MKTLFRLPARRVVHLSAFVGVVLLPLLGVAGTIHSHLLIESGKQFILGGEQPGAFRVSAHNVGPVPVEVRERPRGGGIFGKTTLAPGQRGVLRFAEGSTAVLLNPSAKQAVLDLTVTGDTKRLAMTYEPVSETGAAVK